jgi:hypothetical protein
MEKHTHKSVGPSFVSFCRGKRHQAYLNRFSLLMNYKFSPFPSLGVHPILKNIDVEHKTIRIGLSENLSISMVSFGRSAGPCSGLPSCGTQYIHAYLISGNESLFKQTWLGQNVLESLRGLEDMGKTHKSATPYLFFL